MKELEGRISISRPTSHDDPYIKIQIEDDLSGTAFVIAKVPLANFAEAVTGLAMQKCKIEVRGLDKVGKRKDHQKVKIKFPSDVPYANQKELAHKVVQNYCDKYYPGWTASKYFGSQDSFETIDGVEFVNGQIFRYVEEEKV